MAGLSWTWSTWRNVFSASAESVLFSNALGVIFNVGNYAGPGTYKDGAVAIQVFNPDDPKKVWENLGSDSVTFVLDRSQQSGTLDAKLTNADTGKGGSLHLTGRWNCKA